MEQPKEKRFRSANYNSEEKILLLNLVATYKNILECKKTDMVSGQEKDKVWKEIETKFNCRAPNTVYRTADSLRKYYENIKKKTRKQASEERLQTLLTGGGSKIEIRDPTFDLTMSILNKKTVFGLENTYDSDSISITGITQPANEPIQLEILEEQDAMCTEQGHTDDVNASSSMEIENQVSSNPSTAWSTYKAANLQTPVSRQLENKKTSKDSWTKRRRPAVPSSLSSSQLTKQYSDLASVKLEVAELQKTFLKDAEQQKKHYEEKESELILKLLQLDVESKTMQLTRETEKSKLEKELLYLDIKIKEEQLKKLQLM